MADPEQERLKGGMGQQDAPSNPSAGQSSDEGSGAQSGGSQSAKGAGVGGPSGLDQNDQAGGGLGQNQTGYGGSTQQDTTGGQGTQQANLGAQGQTGHLGPAPGSGEGQPRSGATGGPDLSKGLSDQNQGGGGI